MLLLLRSIILLLFIFIFVVVVVHCVCVCVCSIILLCIITKFPLAAPKEKKKKNAGIAQFKNESQAKFLWLCIRHTEQSKVTFCYLKLLRSFVITRPDTMVACERVWEKERETKKSTEFFSSWCFFSSIKKVNLGTYWEIQI